MTDLTRFRFWQPIEVRYADIDALQHVNNAKYFTYMETARINYMAEVIGWGGDWQDLTIILAHAACDYRLPIRWGDNVHVHLRTTRIGNKSFEFEYALVCVEGETPQIAAIGTTVQVAYDYRQAVSMPVPDEWRVRITDYEPALE